MTTRRDFLLSVTTVATSTVLANTGVNALSALQIASPVANEYARPEFLVDAGWVRTHHADPTVKIVAHQVADDFADGHIPGAAQINWPELEIGDTSAAALESWRSVVAVKIASLGITPVDTVVIYDAETLWGARVWWVLDQLGHADKRVLNGGLAAWRAAGGEIETGNSTVIPAESYPFTPNESSIATIDEVKKAVSDGSASFVDARMIEEYEKGHIPGAVNIPYAKNAADGSPRFFKGAAELTSLYAEAGLTHDEAVIPYCTSGVRSAVTYFTLRLIGYERVSLFTVSWNEWSSDPSLPVSTGDSP